MNSTDHHLFGPEPLTGRPFTRGGLGLENSAYHEENVVRKNNFYQHASHTHIHMGAYFFVGLETQSVSKPRSRVFQTPCFKPCFKPFQTVSKVGKMFQTVSSRFKPMFQTVSKPFQTPTFAWQGLYFLWGGAIPAPTNPHSMSLRQMKSRSKKKKGGFSRSLLEPATSIAPEHERVPSHLRNHRALG